MLISRRSRTLGIALAFTLFVASLGFNTLKLSEGDTSFLMGLICLVFGFSYLPWFANPLFLLSAILLIAKKPRWALGTSALSLILAISTFSIQKAPYNEGGDEANVIAYGPGFFLWLASISVLLSTSFLFGTNPRASANAQPD